MNNEDRVGDRLIEQVLEIWVRPEIARRGLAVEEGAITKVLVELTPKRPPQVMINEEAELVALCRAARPIEAGEQVTTEDLLSIDDLRPHDVDPDSGWICFALIGGRGIVSFDFTRNRGRARAILERAAEYLAAARANLSAGRVAVGVDELHAAAELAVVAQWLLIEDSPPRDHAKRRRWWSSWTQLGNAPSEHGRALAALAKDRNAARYAEKPLQISGARAAELLAVVEAMIDHAHVQAGDRDFGY